MDGFEAFLTEGMDSFGHINLDEHPSSQEACQEMLEDTEKQKLVQNLFLDDAREADDLHMLLDVCLEDAAKREDCTVQTMSHS